jgi:ankyrin repeat protein
MLKKFLKKKFTDENFLLELMKEQQDLEWLAEALETKSININHQDNNKNTFLMILLKKNKLRSVLWLLENGADPTIQNDEQKTAIDIAIIKEKNEILKVLLKHEKVDVNQRDDYGRSLLQNMIISGNLKLAKTLIDGGANLNNIDNRRRHVLYDALSYGDKEFLEYLLSKKGLELNEIDEDGNSIMQHPQVEQDDRLAQDILLAGADPTLLNAKGEPYLFKTALRGKDAKDIVNVALECGANVNAQTINGNTIMMELVVKASKLTAKEDFSLRQSFLMTVEKMLEFGGDINAVDANGESGLFNSVRIRDISLVKFLLDHGIDPNIQNIHGDIVLEMLVYDGLKYVDMVKLLLAAGIDPKIKNKDGVSAYEILTDIILHNKENLLLEDEKTVERIDPDGFYIELVRLLLDYEKPEKGSEYILETFDSHGDPLFFKPLMYDNFALFKVYTLYSINLHMLNNHKHNIFYAYVIKMFEDNDGTPTTCKIFRDNMSSLISRKVDKDFKDSLGWTILHKVTSLKNCNLQLFQTLVNTVRFNYSVTDNLGRTVIHNCVWHNKPEVIKILNKISPETLNTHDAYGIPPIYYAALLGSKALVIEFLELGAYITSSKSVDSRAIKKFGPMAKNFEKLTADLESGALISQIDSLISAIKEKFYLR